MGLWWLGLGLVLGLVAGCAVEPCGLAPEVLPGAVWFRTATETFNRDWDVVLREGALCARSRTDSEGWLEVPGPAEAAPLVALTGDGAHLQVLDADGVLHRGTDLRQDPGRGLSWTSRWGWPAGRGPGLEAATDAWLSVSDSHPFDVDHYQDRLGIEHSVGLGVAHLYRLDADGRTLSFNDWWLPADWSRRICLPEGGGRSAVALSASASTLMVIEPTGQVWTRLYDFDTSGQNDLLTYSYVLDGPAGTTRALPAEDWSGQPALLGPVTDRISIHQDGQGNAARVLRVEAAGGGLFEKRLEDSGWTFVETGEPVAGWPLDPSAAVAVVEDPGGVVWDGTLEREADGASLGVEVLDFDLFCSPAQVRLAVDGTPLALDLHHVHAMTSETRATDWWADGTAGVVRGALLLPDGLAEDGFFGERRVVNLEGAAGIDGLDLWELATDQSFRVPRDEKARPGERLHLVAGAPGAAGPG